MSVLAIDIGGSWTKLGLVDPDGAIDRFERIPTGKSLVDFSRALGAKIPTFRGASGIGLSVAGFIDRNRSMMVYNPNIPWLEQYPLREKLQEQFHLPVSLEVDSNAAALAEYRFGEGRAAPRFLCLTAGTGIGGGFLVDGELVRFSGECIGDAGHIIVEPGGALCTCGAHGCAEAVARDKPDQLGRILGLLAASLAAIFLPDRIAFGGGACAASPEVVLEAQAEFARSAGATARRNAQLVAARLGAHAPLIGAACPLLPALAIG